MGALGMEGGEVTLRLGPQCPQRVLACCVTLIMWPAPSEAVPQHGRVGWASLAHARPSPPVLREAEAAV